MAKLNWGKRSLLTKKFIGTLVAVFALFVQPLVALDVPSAFAAPVINEVMPNPVSISDAAGEWVELKNDDDASVDISGWTIAGGTVPSGQIIAAGGLYVLCATAEATTECDGVSTTNMNLANNGTHKLKLKNANVVVDEFTYIGSVAGQSTEVVNENGQETGVNNDTASYETNQATPKSGNTGTPGAKNTNQPSVVSISNIAELRSAIRNQADGQTWNIAAGEYGLAPFTDITVEGQTGWYLPITASNLTINGIDNPTIYGTGYSVNGNWATQNLVSVFGNNVTIDGFTFMPKVQPNKTLEVLGSDFTLRNTVFSPNTLTNQGEYTDPEDMQWGGSLYFSHAGSHTLQNVKIYNGGLSAGVSVGANITVSDVTLDYTTKVGWINGYRYSTKLTSGTNSLSGTPAVVYHATQALDNLQAVLDSAKAGDTVSIDTDITVSSVATIKSGVNIVGNGNTVSAANTLTNAVFTWSAVSGITISDLTVDGMGKYVHGIKAFKGSANLNDVTIQNAGKHGLQVNSSNVTVNNLTTLNNAWGGVEVTQNNASSTLPAVFTINGTSKHTETTGPDVTVTDITKLATVNDTNNQYSIFENGNARVYRLTTELSDGAGGTVTLPAAGGVAKTPINHELELALGNTTVVVPAGTTVTASSTAWDGTILAPVSSLYVVPGNYDTGVALMVGSNAYTLTFDKPVKIVLAGQAGKRVGFVPAGSSTFTEITTVCSANDETVVASQLAGGYGECKVNDGLGNLVIWTKHFTTFATFAPVTVVPLVQSAPTHTTSSFASIFDTTSTTSTANKAGDVLGTQTTKKTAKTPVVEATESGWKIFGLAWYWWVVIVAALAAAVWYLALRRRNAEN